MVAFGLHLGTCSACLAVHRDGKTQVVANDLGDRVTPAVVAFTDHETVVGAPAKQGIIRNANNTVSHVKRILGCAMDSSEVKEYIQKYPVTVKDEKGSPVFVVEHMAKQAQFNPSKIVELIYGKMLETAQSYSGSGQADAVLAVPSDFTLEQRNFVSNAATKAGFNILRVINEPSAAMLAFDVGQLDATESFKTLVYRLGGTSHDATIVDVKHGMYSIVARMSDSQFGADRFTDVLFDFFAAEFKRQYRGDITENKRSINKLKLAAERCKHALATLLSAQCAVDSLFDGMDFHYNMSRARFDSLCNPLMSHCTQLIQQVLDQAGCGKDTISKIIICGGGAKAPVVKKVICDFLPSSTLLNSVPEDEIIALGAAKEAALLEGDSDENVKVEEQATVKFNSLSKAVCLRVNPTDLEVILPQHGLAPVRRQHTLTLPPMQSGVVMEIFQAEEPVSLDKADLLAKLVIKDLPPGSTIKSNFHLKREGDLHVVCHEVTSDKSESVTIPCC